MDHQRGSLAAVLNVMSDCQLNLTKIQSLPVIETPGEYAFFVDVTFDEFKFYDKARKLIKIMASQFKSGDPKYGLMYELYVIAAVVVGGTSLSGGRGKVFGTLIGAFIIAVIQNGMNLIVSHLNFLQH